MPIDAQVSGYVYNGQIVSVNLIVRTLYHLVYGYETTGNGHSFTTSSYGFRGISLHLGSQSEAWVIDIESRH